MSAKFWSRDAEGTLMRNGLRFVDVFYRQLAYAGTAAFLVAFWLGFTAGAMAAFRAVWP